MEASHIKYCTELNCMEASHIKYCTELNCILSKFTEKYFQCANLPLNSNDFQLTSVHWMSGCIHHS